MLLLLLQARAAPAQTGFLVKVPPQKRVQALWQYCASCYISDQNSAATYRFLTDVFQTADSLGDIELKSYALYFRMCQRIIFSDRYEQHFPKGDYQSVVAIFERAKDWAQQNGYAGIAASCQYYMGQVYLRSAKYGPAFEHLFSQRPAGL